MMFPKIPLALVAACAIVVPMTQVRRAVAVDNFWQGDVSNAYTLAGNWNAGAASPRSSQSERAVIGTDDPAGALNFNLAPFGSPMLTSGSQPPGGIALGLRVIDYDDLNFNGRVDDFLYDEFNDPMNPGTPTNNFDESTLIGKFTIGPGGVSSPATSAGSGVGADGRVLVGVQGRGYLTMTGGSLTAPALVVAGENITTDAGTPQELGPSLVDLSGSAIVNITGGSTGVADMSRRLKVTGPNVSFNASGRLRFVNTSSYTAAITSATSHSTLTTAGNAFLNGSLAVEFSGAAATRDPIASLGTSWDLVKSTLSNNAIDGNFANLGPGGVVQVTGLDAAHAAPLGATYRVKNVAVGATTVSRLSYEQVLILTVNRDTGEMTVRNPYDGQIAIDAYSVTSARGSMVTSYAGLGSSTPNAGVWVKPTPPGANTINALSEVKTPLGEEDAYDLFPVDSVSLGTGFNRLGVGANIENFGFDGEDLVFQYGGLSTNDPLITGHIEYIGTKFENDFVLRVNPTTGQAFLKNDSLTTLKFDGYSLLSSTNALVGAGFTGLGGTWATSQPPTSGALTQTNFSGSTTLAPGAQLPIGDVSVAGFTTDVDKAGLSVQYILSENLPLPGDYNNNHAVDAADYTMWRDHLGQTFQLTNEGFSVTAGTVTTEDYNVWRANFGRSSTTTFRTGSVVFDLTAGSGGGSLGGSPVPEPSAGLLMLMGLGTIGLVRRNANRRAERQSVRASGRLGTLPELGVDTMSKRIGVLLTAMASLGAVLFTTLPAAAATQGIPLINGDFSLPGPIGTKVVAFGETGIPFAPTDPVVTLSSGVLAGGTPGWTFTGGSGIAATGEINAGLGNSLFGDGLPGDSGSEGGGQPGNEMLLSTLDGKVFQTSSFNVVSITPNEKYKLGFDARNIFTPVGAAQLTARLYYVDASSVKQTIGAPLVMSALGDVQRFNIEFSGAVPGDVAALAPALGRPIGVEFDTTSFESDITVGHLQSWAGIDDVILQITGVKQGDLDGDGDIDATDYATLRDNQQETHLFQFEGELTDDSFVNLDDFRAFKNFFNAQGAGGGALGGANVPEPSTFALVVVTTATFAGAFLRRNRRNSGRVNVLLLTTFAIGVALLSASESQAELLAYDPFAIGANPAAGEYTLTTTAGDPPVVQNPLVGQNTMIGPASPSFFGKPTGEAWTIGFGTQAVQATGLSYLGAPAIGGSVNGVGRTERYLRTAWDATTVGTYYMSFLVNFGSTAGAMGYRAVEFFAPDVVPGENRIGDIGYNQFNGALGAVQQSSLTAKIQFNLAGSWVISGGPDSYSVDGINHLLVLKFVLSATDSSDSVSLFLDPQSTDEPVVPNSSVSAFNMTLGSVGSASLGGGDGPTTVFDEIRVGTEFIDVLPELPLPGDTNGDDLVDLLDYNAIISHLNLSGQTLANGDVTCDGKVTIADFRFWKERRTDFPGSGAGSASGTGVPEPSCLMLLFAGAVFVALSIRV